MLKTVKCCSGILELAGEKRSQNIFEVNMGGMLGNQFWLWLSVCARWAVLVKVHRSKLCHSRFCQRSFAMAPSTCEDGANLAGIPLIPSHVVWVASSLNDHLRCRVPNAVPEWLPWGFWPSLSHFRERTFFYPSALLENRLFIFFQGRTCFHRDTG